MRYQKIIFPMLFLLFFSACKTTRTVTDSKVVTTKVTDVIAEVQKNQPQFVSANVSKMSLALNVGDRKLNVSATCKLKKDSAMHISIQPFMGIELFKAELTPDSIWVFDKMNKRYFVSDYGLFSQKFGVDVDYFSLQSLIFGQFFCIGQKDINASKCMLTNKTDGAKIVDFESDNMKQSTQVTAQYIIQQVLINAKSSDYQLSTKYSDYTNLKGINYPQNIALQATNQKSDASCEFSILRVEFNTDITLSRSSTAKYSRGDIDQLIKK